MTIDPELSRQLITLLSDRDNPACVFHGKAATDYTAKLPPISHESCHPLHGKAATPKEVDNRRV